MIIGLTGKFASGKSTAAELFQQAGFYIIDADKIGHSVLEEEKIRKKLCRKFGTDLCSDSGISRKHLGTIVFQDKRKLAFLNKLTHKAIRRKIKTILKKNNHKNIVIDAALLHQMKLDKLTDKILIITADDKEIFKRGISRNRFSEEKIRAILDIQNQSIKKIHKAEIIENNKSRQEFEKQVKIFIRFLLQQQES